MLDEHASHVPQEIIRTFRARIGIQACLSAQHASNISVENRHSMSKHDGGDSTGRVRTDTGDLFAELMCVLGPLPFHARVVHDLLSSFVNAPRPSIVAKTTPCCEYVVDRGICKCVDAGPCLDPFEPVAASSLYTRLLEHDL